MVRDSLSIYTTFIAESRTESAMRISLRSKSLHHGIDFTTQNIVHITDMILLYSYVRCASNCSSRQAAPEIVRCNHCILKSTPRHQILRGVRINCGRFNFRTGVYF